MVSGTERGVVIIHCAVRRLIAIYSDDCDSLSDRKGCGQWDRKGCGRHDYILYLVPQANRYITHCYIEHKKMCVILKLCVGVLPAPSLLLPPA